MQYCILGMLICEG